MSSIVPRMSHKCARASIRNTLSILAHGPGLGNDRLFQATYRTNSSTRHEFKADLSDQSTVLLQRARTKKSAKVIGSRRKSAGNIRETVAKTSSAQEDVDTGGKVASSSWIMVENISPISSLNNMLAGIEDALMIQQEDCGILDLDADPFLTNEDKQALIDPPLLRLEPGNIQSIVRKALVVLSPFGRPTGWKIQFTSRSYVQALLSHQTENPISCAWKPVKIKEWHPNERENGADTLPQITSATLRVEGYPHHMTPLLLMNLFSRFDLDESKERTRSIDKWQGETKDGKRSDQTWLVHFADAAWARAALREKQSSVIKGNKLVLSPYPEQIV